MKKNIVIIGTLDTKGEEFSFLKNEIEKLGADTTVIDCGIIGKPMMKSDITRFQVAESMGTSIEAIIEKRDKNAAIKTMTNGVKKVVMNLYNKGEVQGVISLGGVQGTVLATKAMKSLPVGVPKVMVSTVANGKATFGPFIGTKDVTMIHSVADISGLNMITRKVFKEAAGAIVGMANNVDSDDINNKPTIGLTMAGVTTPCAMKAREVLEELGYEVITFHCNGIGAKAMEELVMEDKLTGILDLSPHDITDGLFDGLMPAYEDRLKITTQKGIPQVIIPGCADIILYGGLSNVPESKRDRKLVEHNPIHTHVKANYDEMKMVGRYIANRTGDSLGPVGIVVPEGGFSQLNCIGGPIYEPESDCGFADGIMEVKNEISNQNIELIKSKAHINDEEFAIEIAKLLHKYIKEVRDAR
ncbi:Tm-1-like ATP-binding domain-containing protein [Vallitalea sp.]|jgi:uncharacterized protein (UPF0261 family)|uniref:Tm-1-like ATP-binding domain-containing protein n=1 Tax=Vallitalea sp. TaxID=1882829 RepID=UPI0025DD641A|nr:Tm-1-like ATP-binding domain-containing protein [Vallitalea sp.]MCT4686001.1 Tm-1-like ATP-binding domain-containing protein [Vallitalea sp.]